jgi:hypothetical protein
LLICAVLALFFAGIPRASAQAIGSHRGEQAQDEQSNPPQQPQEQQPAAFQPSPPQPEPDADSNGNNPSLITPLKPQNEAAVYVPITRRQRLRWLITNTIGPPHLAGGVITSAFGTAVDRPREYGTSWPGFGERFGIRLTGVATSNVMEAGLGAILGEDPRYFRVMDQPFGARLKNVVKQTFYARRADGDYSLAYARFMAISGSNFVSNAWRADSEANTHDAILRTLEGFAGRMSSNAFEEFWPSVSAKLFHRGD